MSSLVEVAQFFDPEEALVAQGYLRAQGISTIIQNEHHLNVAPWLRVALGGYRLLAIRENATAATAALYNLPDVNETTTTQSESSNLEKPPQDFSLRRNWLWTPLAFFSNTPFVPVYRSNGELLLQLTLLFCFYAGLVYSMNLVGGFWRYLLWFLT